MLANGGWDLTLILLTWTIWRAPTNASKWRMGFNSAFKGLTLNAVKPKEWQKIRYTRSNALSFCLQRTKKETPLPKMKNSFQQARSLHMWIWSKWLRAGSLQRLGGVVTANHFRSCLPPSKVNGRETKTWHTKTSTQQPAIRHYVHCEK